MKLDLSPVVQARKNLAAAEAQLLAMRARLDDARALVDTREQEQRLAAESLRQAIISGTDEEAASRALSDARSACADALGRIPVLEEVVRQAEDSVIAAEGELLVELERVRLAQYEAAKKELSTAILRYGPAYQSAALSIGLAWPTLGRMLSDLADRDLGPFWQKSQPIEELVARHKSQLVSEDRRTAG